MTAIILPFPPRAKSHPAPAVNPFRDAMASLAGLNAALYGAAAQHWAAIAEAWRTPREDIGNPPSDWEPPEGAA